MYKASAATINTLMVGIPSILYGIAKDGTLPEIFGRVHPRYQSPYYRRPTPGLTSRGRAYLSVESPDV
jgi:hypothetical protein